MKPVSIFGTLLLGACLACTNMDKRAYDPSPDSIKIGWTVNLANPRNESEREKAALLAMQEINDAGGVLGHKLDLLVTGDSYTPLILNGTQQLLDAGVPAIIGGNGSNLTLAMAPLTTNRVPIISPAAVSPDVSKLPGAGTWVFHLPPSNSFQGQFMAAKALSMGINSMGVIYTNDTSAIPLAAAFKQAYQANGGTLLSYVLAPANSPSGYGTYVTSLLKSGVPAGIMIITSQAVNGARITQDIQVANPQPKPTYFGSGTLNSSAFLLNAAPSIRDGMYGSSTGTPTDENSMRFINRYTELVGHEPFDAYTACSYDAVYLIAYAMLAGKAATPQVISQNLRDVSGGITPKGTPVYVNEFAKGAEILAGGGHIDYQGASGKVDFNATGDPTSGVYVWWQIKDGAVNVLETITFSGN